MGLSLGSDEFGESQKKNSMLAEINVTPLVDVMLVLLIILMVSAPFAVSGVNIHLPAAKTKAMSLSGDPLVLSVNNKGQFFIGQHMIAAKDLTDKLKVIKGSAKDASIYIRADKNVPYGKVMDAMAAAQNAGIYKIAMLGETPTHK